MNNDPTPAPAERILPPVSPSEDASNELAHGTAAAREQQQSLQSPAHGRAQVQLRKRIEFVSSLLTDLDVLVYAELCILYYME
jgi:hypothetical protein